MTSKNVDLISIEDIDIEAIYSGINDWIAREHSLISDRMSWLVSANAFLFTPVAIVLANTVGSTNTNSIDYIWFIHLLCGLGVVLSIAVGLTIGYAYHTLNRLIKRKRSILNSISDTNSPYLHIEPGRITSQWDKRYVRYRRTHEVCNLLQLFIPVALLVSWIIIFIKV